jgi:hypothetical protein
VTSAAIGIETASLPALAGESGPIPSPPSVEPTEPAVPVVEPAALSPEIVTVADNRAEAYSSPGGEARGNDGNPPVEADGAAPVAEVPDADPLREQHSAPIQAAPEAEPAREAQPTPEVQTTPATESEPAEVVQEVTKKPENPRRGWWQRLIQS